MTKTARKPSKTLSALPGGFQLVEVMLSCALLGVLVTALTGAYLYGQESTRLAGNRVQALLLAEEGLEAVRNIRDAAFDDLADGTFGIDSTSTWGFSGTSDVTDIFTRTVTIASLDAERKSALVTVTWQQNAQRTGSITLETQLTDWQSPVVVEE